MMLRRQAFLGILCAVLSASGAWQSIHLSIFGRTESPRLVQWRLQAIPDEGDEGVSSGRPKRRVAIIGAGWGGLSAAHALSKELGDFDVTVIDASARVGGLVRDSFSTKLSTRPAEAGQHGFWTHYKNIFRLFHSGEIDGFDVNSALTSYAPQGQFSPRGLEAVWPVYQDQPLQLPTGLAQAVYTNFLQLPLLDRLTAFPLALALLEFNDSVEAWQRFDQVSFRDLCQQLGVSRRCYQEAFEPMILTGLFAPGAECSAAAALGMAYFFVLQSQTAFDVRWCRGNIGQVILDPWVETMKRKGVRFQSSTRVTGFDMDWQNMSVKGLRCQADNGTELALETDHVIFAVGAKALNALVRASPELSALAEFQRFANLRGTSVLATRLFLDQNVSVPFTANACWGFDPGVGMTLFDIRSLHGANCSTVAGAPGAVLEVDYYHADRILVMNDDDIIAKVKKDLDDILGSKCRYAKVVDAAVVRLPEAVNWYFPGSYSDMPDLKSSSLSNVYFCGDLVRTRHGSWSQEKAFVTGLQAVNLLLGRPIDHNVLPLDSDELHVKLGRDLVAWIRQGLGNGDPAKGPSLVDFWR